MKARCDAIRDNDNAVPRTCPVCKLGPCSRQPVTVQEVSDIGKSFRLWRAENGMLLIHASTLMGVKPSQLSGWETRREPWPDDMRERVERLIGYPNFNNNLMEAEE